MLIQETLISLAEIGVGRGSRNLGEHIIALTAKVENHKIQNLEGQDNESTTRPGGGGYFVTRRVIAANTIKGD